MDLVWGNDGSNGVVGNTVSFVLNEGMDGDVVQFASAVTLAVGYNPSDIAAGDIDGDGAPDLAVSITDGNSVVLMFNRRDGSSVSFDLVTVQVGESPYDVELADFNNDTLIDVAVSNNGADSISLLTNLGQRQFAERRFFAGQGPLGIASADFNGDLRIDLAVTAGNSVGVLLNLAFNSFSSPTQFAVGQSPAEILAMDFDNDGRPDLATPNYNSQTLSILMNSGRSNRLAFSSAVFYATGNRPWGVEKGDWDGDNLTDLAVTNVADNSVSLFFQSRTVQPTVRPVSESVSGGLVFGIIVAVAFGGVILLFVIFYLLKARSFRRQRNALVLAHASAEAGAHLGAGSSAGTRSYPLTEFSNRQMAAMRGSGGGGSSGSDAAYPVAKVALDDEAPLGAPDYQAPPPGAEAATSLETSAVAYPPPSFPVASSPSPQRPPVAYEK